MTDTATTRPSRFIKMVRRIDTITALFVIAGLGVIAAAVALALGNSGGGTEAQIAEQYGLSSGSVSIVGDRKRGDNVRALIAGEPYECFKGETWTCRAVLLGAEPSP